MLRILIGKESAHAAYDATKNVWRVSLSPTYMVSMPPKEFELWLRELSTNS